MIERSQSVSAWAREAGVHRHTLAQWIRAAALELPARVRGSKYLLRESDIRRVIALHSVSLPPPVRPPILADRGDDLALGDAQ